MRSADKEQKKKMGVIKVFLKLAPVVIAATPLLFLTNFILNILHGTFWGIETMARQHFFDKAALFAAGDAKISDVFFALALLSGAAIITQILNGVANFVPNLIIKKQTASWLWQFTKKLHGFLLLILKIQTNWTILIKQTWESIIQ